MTRPVVEVIVVYGLLLSRYPYYRFIVSIAHLYGYGYLFPFRVVLQRHRRSFTAAAAAAAAGAHCDFDVAMGKYKTPLL